MNAVQIARAADLILEKFYYFKIEDFKLCFENAKMGFYGQVFGRIDLQILFGWLTQYENERADAAELITQGEHNEIRSEEKDRLSFMPPKK